MILTNIQRIVTHILTIMFSLLYVGSPLDVLRMPHGVLISGAKIEAMAAASFAGVSHSPCHKGNATAG